MKIVVYAICKNEEQFVERWMDSMSEADQVVVLDTGSEDATAERLEARGALVTRGTVSPWRFDAARNRSLELVDPDADVCVCTDLDEVFRPGWRKALEEAWIPGASQVCYRYTWSFTPGGGEDVVFWPEKIHSRQGWKWVHPVHEVLAWVGSGRPGPRVTAEGVQLNHYPDPGKSRGQYLPLLELSVQEDPQDDRNVHYLGREYLYRGRWDDCIRTLERHLAMPRALWQDERAASMRYIARAWEAKGDLDRARDWLLRAAGEAPYLREAWVELAMLLYRREDWDGVLYCTGCALAIGQRPRTYLSEAKAWGSLPHDLRAMACYHTGRLGEAAACAEKARRLEPGNERLEKNAALLAALAEKES